nr:SPFH domain-containing protein [uncultured Desulfobacter sp.]
MTAEYRFTDICQAALQAKTYTRISDAVNRHVSPSEKRQALVLRFGQIIKTEGVIEPGLHWKMPWPIDRVQRVRSRRLFSLAAGNTADANTPMIWQFDHGDTTTYVSGDNNLFLPYLILHYRIKNPQDYYLSYRSGSADRLLEYEANRILTHIFATKIIMISHYLTAGNGLRQQKGICNAGLMT